MTALDHAQSALQHLRASAGYKAARAANKAQAKWLQTEASKCEQELLAAIDALTPIRKLVGFATGAGPDTYTGMDAPSRSKYLDAIIGYGGNVIRFDCVGNAHELSLFQDAHARGIEVIPIVMQLVDPVAYADRARAVATMAKPFGISRYELGNEPNIPTGGLTISQFGGISGYVRSSNAGYDAIKLVDPSARVSTAGFAAYGIYGQIDGDSYDMRVFLEKCVAAGLKFDAVAAHPYGYYTGDDLAKLTDDEGWRGWTALLTGPHSLKAIANGKPLWVTEVGMPSTGHGWTGGFGEQLQADYAAWCVRKIREEPSIELGCLYSAMDYKALASTDQGHFGVLLRADWSVKPGAQAFAVAVT